MDAINGISLRKYAELCAKMKDVINDHDACAQIAREAGIKRSDWVSAHKAWQEKITDPADKGRTASRFVDIWNNETGKKRPK
jgi:hypothetical protein